MKKYLKTNQLFTRSWHILKYNLILVQPLLLFFLLIGLATSQVNINPLANKAGISLIVAIFGLSCAFISGWCSMLQRSLEVVDKNLSQEEKAVYSINLFKEFFPGVGQYFPQILLGSIFYFILAFILINIIDFIGLKLIGIPHTLMEQNLTSALVNEETARQIMSNISAVDKVKMTKWYFLTLGCVGFFNYLTMFWTQAVIVARKNFLKAYFESFKAVLSKPIATFAIFFSYWLSIIIASVVCQIGVTNIIFQFLGLMLMVIVIVYFTVLTFLYFGQYAENNSISRANCFR